MPYYHINRNTVFKGWFLYTCFLVYGSIVPLAFHWVSIADAIEKFSKIQFFNLALYQRADWVANLVLFIPIAYGAGLILIRLDGRVNAVYRFVASSIIWCYCFMLAISIEFLQIYFPGRTVSQNDLYAEGIGAFLGLVIVNFFGHKLLSAWYDLKTNGKKAVKAVLSFYVIAYVAYVLFPFDLLVSLSEVKNKFSSGDVSIFWSARTHANIIYSCLQPIAEMFSVVPIGILYAVITSQKKMGIVILFGTGALFGAAVEFLQLFIATGITQGLSVLVKGVGFTFGYYSAAWFKNTAAFLSWGDREWVKRFFQIFGALYLVLLTVINFGAKGKIVSLATVVERFGSLIYIPFYYHWRVSESRALFSVISYSVLYLPAGLFMWYFTKGKKATYAVISALGIAFVMEFGKFFFAGSQPDFTNLIIAAVSSLCGFHVAAWCNDRIEYIANSESAISKMR